MTIEPLPVPLRQDETGTLRVADTRIPLERVVEAYRDGACAEDIVRQFDSLRLADVYAVLTYYLSHEEEVKGYLQRQEELAAALQRQIEAAQPSRPGFRDELLARRARLENRNAPPGE